MSRYDSLVRLLTEAMKTPMTEEERREQAISYVLGQMVAPDTRSEWKRARAVIGAQYDEMKGPNNE